MKTQKFKHIIFISLLICFLFSCSKSSLDINKFNNGNGYTIKDVYDAVLHYNNLLPKNTDPFIYESLQEKGNNYILEFRQFEKDYLVITFDKEEQMKDLKYEYHDNQKNMSHAFIQVFPSVLFVDIEDEQYLKVHEVLNNLNTSITYDFKTHNKNVKITFDNKNKLFSIALNE